MPTWGGILREINDATAARTGPKAVSPFDLVRRRYLAKLAAHTGRNTILYASNWTGGLAQDAASSSMVPEDIHGFMEVMHGLRTGSPVDVILHLPGGRPEATESVLGYLRSKFSNVRVLVPHAAMSAATMLACGADRIVMGRHSFLGPIDPQMPVRTQGGLSYVAAHAILAQWALAQAQCSDPTKLPSWLPILQMYGPALLVQCRLASDLSRELVEQWLKKYMFANLENSDEAAASVAAGLADHGGWKTHGRFLGRDRLREMGLVIDDLETDHALQDLVLSTFHATTHTFNGTPCSKIIENHLGKCWLKLSQQVLIHAGQPLGPAAPPPAQIEWPSAARPASARPVRRIRSHPASR